MGGPSQVQSLRTCLQLQSRCNHLPARLLITMKDKFLLQLTRMGIHLITLNTYINIFTQVTLLLVESAQPTLIMAVQNENEGAELIGLKEQI